MESSRAFYKRLAKRYEEFVIEPGWNRSIGDSQFGARRRTNLKRKQPNSQPESHVSFVTTSLLHSQVYLFSLCDAMWRDRKIFD